MYCRNCSNEVSVDAIACPKCGVPPLKGKHFCNNCGAPTHEDAIICVNCAVEFKNSTSSDLSLNIKTEDIVQGWSKYSYSTYVIILLLSLLPFINIKCAATNVVSVTGYDMAIGKQINNLNGEIVSLFRWDMLAFYIIIAVCLFLVENKKYIQAQMLTGLSFLLLLQFAYRIYSKLKDNDVPSINYSFGLGFWLTLGLIILTISLLEKYIALNKINPKSPSPPLAEADKPILPPPLLNSGTPPPLFDSEKKEIQFNGGDNGQIHSIPESSFIKSINEETPSLPKSDDIVLPPPIPYSSEKIPTEAEHNEEETSEVYQQILDDEKQAKSRNRMIIFSVVLLIIIISTVIWVRVLSNRNNGQPEVSAINEIPQNVNDSFAGNTGGVIFTNLSNDYDFKISLRKEAGKPQNVVDMDGNIIAVDDHPDSILKTITIDIVSKLSKQINQTIIIDGKDFDRWSDFQDIQSVRSSITGINKNKDIVDGDYGNFIVDDFNMDGREDFAIKKDCGQGQAGCHYKFYTLRNDGNFKEDTFLTNEISNPPDIDTKSKTVSTFHIDWDLPNTTDADPQGYIRAFYSYNPSTETWTKIKTVHENPTLEPSLNNNNNPKQEISNSINEKEIKSLETNKRLSEKVSANELASQQLVGNANGGKKNGELGNINIEVDKIYKKVEIQASFPGGPGKWAQFVQRAIQSGIDEFSKSDYGTCVVRFIVDKSGKVSNVDATTMKGTKLADIAIDAIKKGPNWIPAQINGRIVNAYRLQPVTLTDPDR